MRERTDACTDALPNGTNGSDDLPRLHHSGAISLDQRFKRFKAPQPALRGMIDVCFFTPHSLFLLAQDAPETNGGGGLTSMMPALMVIMLLFYFLILRPQKNKEKKFRSLIDNLKEKDRVVTIGGIHGVVTNVQRDADMVTIRIDESTGAKIRIGTSAIARLVTDEERADK